jgi:hypothetical protein
MAVVFKMLLGLPATFQQQHAAAEMLKEKLRQDKTFESATFRLDTCPPIETEGPKGSFLFMELGNALVLEVRMYMRQSPRTFTIETELLPFSTRAFRIAAVVVSFVLAGTWIFLASARPSPILVVVGVAAAYFLLSSIGDHFTRQSHRRAEAELNRSLEHLFEEQRPRIEKMLGVSA